MSVGVQVHLRLGVGGWEGDLGHGGEHREEPSVLDHEEVTQHHC